MADLLSLEISPSLLRRLKFCCVSFCAIIMVHALITQGLVNFSLLFNLFLYNVQKQLIVIF